MFVVRLPAFVSNEEFAQPALQENEPRFDMQALRFPSCGYEQSNVHAHVATVQFLMNFRTHQMCLSSSDSDHLILQQGTEKLHVSDFLNSQPVGLGLLAELLTGGVEHPAGTLADARDLPLMLLKFCEQISSLVFQCVSCDTSHLTQ